MPQNYLNFSQKVVLVTGSTKNIGKAIARLFAEHGATVIINSRSPKDIEKTVEEFKKDGLRAFGAPADIGDWKEVEAMILSIDKNYGRLDVLINNAGIRASGGLDSLEEENWNDMFRTNVLGVFNISKAVLPLMKKQKGGAIVNIISQAAFARRGDHTGMHYAASKGAIFSLTRHLAFDLGEFGIRVNAVMPALVVTEEERSEVDRNYYEKIKEMSPLKRLVTSQDTALVTLFLASDMAPAITGTIISIGGGA